MKKSFRNALAMALALCMVFALAACGTTPATTNPPEGTPTAAPKIKIGVTLMNFSTEFSINLNDYMKAKAEQMGDVELLIVDAGGDAAKQVQQIESFVAQKVDAIIM
ncbi:MAG: substrate-binding domain-containing protein, partial [Oscillospiraceae bacterium]